MFNQRSDQTINPPPEMGRDGSPAVLIVDREPLIRRYIRSIVNQMELFLIFEADDCKEALKLVKEINPLIIIIDIGLNPEEASDLIRVARTNLPHLTFVVALSASGHTVGHVYSNNLEADFYLDKNFSHPELSGILRNIKRQADYLQTIAEKELHYRTIFNLSDEPMLLIDSNNFTVLDINHAALNLLEYKPDSDAPQDYSGIFSSPNPFKRIIQERVTYTSGIKIKKVNQRNFTATASFVYFDHRHMVLMSLKDITEQLQNRDEKLAIQKLLEQGRADTKEIIAFMSAEANERRRIGRELHDHIGQMLISIKMGIECARTSTKSPKALTMLEAAQKEVLDTISAVRAFSHEMNIDFIPHSSLSTAISDLVEKMQLRSLFDLDLAIDPIEVELNGFIQSNIYRIAEESFTNIVKHTRKGKIGIRFFTDQKSLILSIEGKGSGTNAKSSKGGLGMRIMQQRAALIGGTLEVEGVSGRSFKVLLNVPF